MDITPPGPSSTPYAILRDVASGCAYPAAYAVNVLGVVTNNATTGGAWLDSTQSNLHRVYANDYLPQSAMPPSRRTWLFGSAEPSTCPALFRMAVT